MDSKARGSRLRHYGRKGVKLTALILALIIFIILIFFVLGIIFDRWLAGPGHF